LKRPNKSFSGQEKIEVVVVVYVLFTVGAAIGLAGATRFTFADSHNTCKAQAGIELCLRASFAVRWIFMPP
jgi:hypothetical protein